MHSNKIDQLEENIHSHIFLFSTDDRLVVVPYLVLIQGSVAKN